VFKSSNIILAHVQHNNNDKGNAPTVPAVLIERAVAGVEQNAVELLQQGLSR
jgi:hypothetical protein